MTIFEAFSVVSFAVAMLATSYALLLWIREPVFEILEADFRSREQQFYKKRLRVIIEGQVKLLAVGGRRQRLLVDYHLAVDGAYAEPAAIPDAIPIPPAGTSVVTLPTRSKDGFSLNDQPLDKKEHRLGVDIRVG